MKPIGLSAFLLYSRIKIIRRIAWRLFGPEGEAFNPPATASRVLVGGDVSFDSEMRTIPYVGAYRLNIPGGKQSVWGRLYFKFWKLFFKLTMSPRYFSTFIYQPFQELLVKNPENDKKK